jgi:hypothetical protein
MVLHFLQVAADPPILPNLQKLHPAFFSNQLPLERIKIFEELPSPLPGSTYFASDFKAMTSNIRQLSAAPTNERAVGELLIGFFDYYASFDFRETAISIARGRTYSR